MEEKQNNGEATAQQSPPQHGLLTALAGTRPPGIGTLWTFHGSFTVLREAHDKGCQCSYCKKGQVGLLLPENKARNSWRSIRWRWRGGLQVLRWTLPSWWPWKGG